MNEKQNKMLAAMEALGDLAREVAETHGWGSEEDRSFDTAVFTFISAVTPIVDKVVDEAE